MQEEELELVDLESEVEEADEVNDEVNDEEDEEDAADTPLFMMM